MTKDTSVRHKKVRELRELSFLARKKGDLQKECEISQQILKLDNLDQIARRRLAEIYVKQNKIDEAIEIYEILSNHYFREGMYQKSLAMCKIAIKIDPKNEQAMQMIQTIASRKVLDDVYHTIEKNKSHFPLFKKLNSHSAYSIISNLKVEKRRENEVVIKEGQNDSSIYTLVEGSVSVVKKTSSDEEVILARLEAGAFVGEMALLKEVERVASVITNDDSIFLELTRENLTEINKDFPEVGEVAQQFYEMRILSNLFLICPVFQPFSVDDQSTIIRKFIRKSITPGTIVLKEGEQAGGLYVILHGHCDVLTQYGQEDEQHHNVLKEADFFGEISMLHKVNATATIRTRTNCEMLMLPREDFDQMIMTHPQLLETVSVAADEKLRRTEKLMLSLEKPNTSFLL